MAWFSVPVFFVIFRETFEAAIVLSVLLALVTKKFDQDVAKKFQRQIWMGTGSALLLTIMVGGGLIVAFNITKINSWESVELLFEGVLAASLLIAVVSISMLKLSSSAEKWEAKLIESVDSSKPSFQKYTFALVPFFTIAREGIEAILIMGGVALGSGDPEEPKWVLPLSSVCGLLAGLFVGYIIYRGGKAIQIKILFILSTILLLIMGSGLFSKGIYQTEAYFWTKNYGLADPDAGAINLVDVRSALWYLKCCDPRDPESVGWQTLEALVGWRNVATVMSVTGYCIYWITVIAYLVFTERFQRKKILHMHLSLLNSMK